MEVQPKELLVSNYKYKSRRGKKGFSKVYQCTFCSYQLHDRNKIAAHQKKCYMQTVNKKLTEKESKKKEEYFAALIQEEISIFLTVEDPFHEQFQEKFSKRIVSFISEEVEKRIRCELIDFFAKIETKLIKNLHEIRFDRLQQNQDEKANDIKREPNFLLNCGAFSKYSDEKKSI